MSSISDDPLFPTVLEAIRNIVGAIADGIEHGLPEITVEGPAEEFPTISRLRWADELTSAKAFFEKYEYYDDCAECVRLETVLDNEPTVQKLLTQLPNANPSHND